MKLATELIYLNATADLSGFKTRGSWTGTRGGFKKLINDGRLHTSTDGWSNLTIADHDYRFSSMKVQL